MTTLTSPVWLWAVLGGLAAFGFMAACWVAAFWAERAADWWHARERPADPPWWRKPWLYRFRGDGQDAATEEAYCYPECPPGCNCSRLELPPERTWEQMTSHQLPLEERLVGELERQGWFDADVQARLRAEHEARRMSPVERKDWQQRERIRKRQAKRAEMTHRAHYAAMGLDYPSGLMARVRELAP